MSDGIETTRTIVNDGVTVQKTIDTDPGDGAETATVTLDITADRSAPATVRLTEHALASIPDGDVELASDHGADHWRFADPPVFERGFDPGESLTVVYRVSEVDPDRFERLDDDTEVTVVADAEADAGALIDRGASDTVRGLIDGDRESLLDATDADGPTADAPAADASTGPDPVADPSRGDGGADATGSDADGTAVPGAPASDAPGHTDEQPRAAPSGGVARVLVKELEQGYVDEETRTRLREELEPGRSRDVRIKHLQSQVGDFAAYVEMLETFIDRYGTFDEVFEGMDDDLSALDDEMSNVRSELEGVDDRIDDVDAVADDLEALDDAHGSLADEVGALDDDVADLNDGQDDLAARVESLESELERVEARLDEYESFKERLSGVFQEMGGDAPGT